MSEALAKVLRKPSTYLVGGFPFFYRILVNCRILINAENKE